jgi:hypothetical protein
VNEIIILADLGHFRAYRISKGAMDRTKIDLIESFDTLEGHGKLGEKVTDSAGRFGVDGGRIKGGTGFGEPHNIELETKKRLIKLIARDISSLIERENCQKWYFAASKMINNQIVDNLNHNIQKKLQKNISSNLTKIDKSEILQHFE